MQLFYLYNETVSVFVMDVGKELKNDYLSIDNYSGFSFPLHIKINICYGSNEDISSLASP